jgi:hypothetical protein
LGDAIAPNLNPGLSIMNGVFWQAIKCGLWYEYMNGLLGFKSFWPK